MGVSRLVLWCCAFLVSAPSFFPLPHSDSPTCFASSRALVLTCSPIPVHAQTSEARLVFVTSPNAAPVPAERFPNWSLVGVVASRAPRNSERRSASFTDAYARAAASEPWVCLSDQAPPLQQQQGITQRAHVVRSFGDLCVPIPPSAASPSPLSVPRDQLKPLLTLWRLWCLSWWHIRALLYQMVYQRCECEGEDQTPPAAPVTVLVNVVGRRALTPAPSAAPSAGTPITLCLDPLSREAKLSSTGERVRTRLPSAPSSVRGVEGLGGDGCWGLGGCCFFAGVGLRGSCAHLFVIVPRAGRVCQGEGHTASVAGTWRQCGRSAV